MPEPEQPNNQNNQADSSTVCYIKPSGVRKHTSIRVDSGLWEAFIKALSEKGLSSCEILEKLILGLTVGLKTSEQHVAQGATINVFCEVPKFVRRVRRARVEYVDERVSGERFYCALKDEHLDSGLLPLVDCQGCPNGSCRKYVFERLSREFEGGGFNE